MGMDKTSAVTTPEELRLFCAFPGETPLRTQPDGDEHLLTLRDGDVQARCSLWWQDLPTLGNDRLGYVGHFAARSKTAALDLLDRACRKLAQQGCTLAVGPIDGNTWRRYRFMTQRGNEPTFFLEPDNPDEWPGYFRDAGFEPLAHYTSAIDRELHELDPRVEDIAGRMRLLDVRIRHMDPARFDDEVNRIFEVSLVAFRKAFLYSPIDREQCRTLYEPLKQFIRPELVLIAEQRDIPIGFVFAVPDWLQAQRGAVIDTVIVKTIAILPQHEYAGLGALLLSQCRSRIAELGFARAIHALMHDANVSSRRLSDRYGQTMRGYTLFARSLRGLL
jgi:L-amino acid N-acyltransferase YncA